MGKMFQVGKTDVIDFSSCLLFFGASKYGSFPTIGHVSYTANVKQVVAS